MFQGPTFGFSPNRNCWGPVLRRKRNAPGGMGGARLRSWGPAEFGWLARGVWMGGTRLWSWGPAEFGWVARGFGAGDPRNLDGWHAALELGARGVWIGGTALELGARGFAWLARGSGAGGPRRLSSWGPAEFGWVARGLARGVWMDAWGPACSEPNWFCKMRRKMNMMSHSNCSGCCGGR